MNGDAVGDRRPPGRIGAGVEVAVELDRGQPAVAAGGEAGRHARRVALGGGAHRFRPRVGAAHRAAEQPRRDGDERLHRDVQLAAEAAAAGGRQHAHLLRPQAQDRRHLVAVHVGRLGTGRDHDALADPLGVARLRLDVGVLEEGGLEAAFGHRRGARHAGRHVAPSQPAADQHVVRILRMQGAGARRQRRVHVVERRRRPPLDRHVLVRDGRDGVGVADERRHRLAAKAHEAFRQHRLVLDVGVDSESVAARHVAVGEDAHEAGEPGLEAGERTDREFGAHVGRAHDAEPQGVGGRGVGAEALGAVELGQPIDFRQPGADRATRRRRRRIGLGPRIEHRLDDLAVAGAAAQHAAQRVHHRRLVRRRVAPQQIGGRHQHARRADAALRRAVAMKGPLQGRRLAVPGEALDRGYAAPAHLPQRHHAGAHLRAVQQHRARAAVAGVAADLGSRQSQVLAQDIGEPADRRRLHGHRTPVHDEWDRLDARLHRPASNRPPTWPSARRSRVSAASCR